MENLFSLGIDIGSTTIKAAVTNEANKVVYQKYQRHLANIQGTLKEILEDIHDSFKDVSFHVEMTGNASISLAQHIHVPFIQEVIASTFAVKEFIPETDVAIELGGEDAKIMYFTGGTEQRMNGICAGGTGAFIDQMATLLGTDAAGLNELAKKAEMIYPIASRCGVFAKSDIQPLLNEGVKKENIAASIFHAVVNQTICGLACGRPIKGNVAFLGGPLFFLSELRKSFQTILELGREQAIFPSDSHMFACFGACLYAQSSEEVFSLPQLLAELESFDPLTYADQQRLPSLFADEKEYDEFRARHEKSKAETADLSAYAGKCYLGIDAGSTTTKLALIDDNGRLLHTFYENNNGNPLQVTMRALKDIYSLMPDSASIAWSCVTGYGENLIKAALRVDMGKVETIAHYKGASFFMPNVNFILDIGGQDIKCMRIRDHAVDSIFLNEACSSGCGSFIDTFAQSLGYTIKDFAQSALYAVSPVDLGSRCTVFMNSRVKQAQKEGASVEDISAGLSYSVIKNALMKVIKVSDFDELGENIVVQGGTFKNDAVLRSFETYIGKNVIRPDIAGLVGAYGAALIARESSDQCSTLLTSEEIDGLKIDIKNTRCNGCTNQCMLTVNHFSGSNRQIFVSGNRCERGALSGCAAAEEKIKLPNLYEYKFNRFFGYTSLSEENAPSGSIGLPRVLNMFENYPFWHSFLTALGYRVVLSEESTGRTFLRGIESIPSETVCYPAKLVHGHILSLIDQGVNTIFYPSVAYEEKEMANSDNCFNCPVVTSYSENIKNNMDILKTQGIRFLNPFISLSSCENAVKRLVEIFMPEGFSKEKIRAAAQAAWDELMQARADLHQQGKETVEFLKAHHQKGIVLAGRPYHIDNEINHGIPKLINELGFAVLTEDSVAFMAHTEKVEVVNQWAYHARLYAAAMYVTTQPQLELVQLNSFGCGLDAVTADEIQRILNKGGKLYTLLKIDEINNLGTAKIRLRSLAAAIEEREKQSVNLHSAEKSYVRVPFTEEMKKKHTILCPQMSPIHFQFLQTAFTSCGYNLEVLPEVDDNAINEGLRYVNNDACYPTLIVVGQMISALKSGRYDLANVSLAITQTGGGCRATNYISLLRKALVRAGFENIPVISLNASGLEKNPGMKYSFALIHRSIMGIVYGDLFMRVLYKVRPNEKVKGTADFLYDQWVKKCHQNVADGNILRFRSNIKNIVADFDKVELNQTKKPSVGIVGEILVKFHPTANNDLVRVLESEGAEAVVPDLLDFLLYCAINNVEKRKYYHTPLRNALISKSVIWFLELYRKTLIKAVQKSSYFSAPLPIEKLAELASSVVSTANQTGEGWLLTAEMLELIHSGVDNILCLQPFACLPNHITGKGVMKELKRLYPSSNLYPLDYDSSASAVNQLNRIKLMLAESKINYAVRKQAETQKEYEYI